MKVSLAFFIALCGLCIWAFVVTATRADNAGVDGPPWRALSYLAMGYAGAAGSMAALLSCGCQIILPTRE